MINKGIEHTKVRKNRGIVKLMNGKKKSKSISTSVGGHDLYEG